MPRVLIAGCGYVGQATADLFHDRGWMVEGWTVSPQSAGKLMAKPYPVRVVDITNAGDIGGVREEFDVVIQCASSGGGSEEEYRRVYRTGARNLVDAFPRASLLFTSSTSVYAQKQGEIVDETSPANPVHERGRILLETEEIVLSHDGMVARLGGIYGPGRSFHLRKFLAGEGVIDDANDRFLNQAHRDDIASALFLLAERRTDLTRQVFNVVDDQPLLASDAYRWLSGHLQRSFSSGNLAARRKRGDSNKRVSNKKLRALGWEPRYPNFDVAMKESVLPSFGLEG
jgi:nucleoside-diphosphate-sugar epimerase